jgi:hypothetical protein
MPKAKRVIKLASQNETVRKAKDETDICLATLDLKSFMAIIFLDKQGNASLTYIDANTNISFMYDEAKCMEDDYTIFIALTESPNKVLRNEVNEFLNKNINKLCNFKATYETKKTHTQCVLLKDGKLYPPSPKDFSEILFDTEISSDNALRNYIIENGKKDFQLRIFERELATYLRPFSKNYPDVVYSDKRWKEEDEYYTLPESLKNDLEALKLYRYRPGLLGKLEQLAYAVTNQFVENNVLINKSGNVIIAKDYIEQFMQGLVFYWDYMDVLELEPELSFVNKAIASKGCSRDSLSVGY